jgi:hypothetical protein
VIRPSRRPARTVDAVQDASLETRANPAAPRRAAEVTSATNRPATHATVARANDWWCKYLGMHSNGPYLRTRPAAPTRHVRGQVANKTVGPMVLANTNYKQAKG